MNTRFVETRKNAGKERTFSYLEIIVLSVMGIVLAIFLSLFFSFRAESAQRERIYFDNSAYENSEKQFRADMKQVLAGYGYEESGITMTKCISAGGQRSYEVKIHNDRFEKMNEDKGEMILLELKAISFVDPQLQKLPVEFELFWD